MPLFLFSIPRQRLKVFYRYHWGFLVGPKVEDKQQVAGMRYHVKNHFAHGWTYEQVPLPNIQSTNNLLARIVVAKVEDEDRPCRDLPQYAGRPE